ncbi:MAG TPA: hypothetical protein VKB26_13550 [Candidatus Acidoferrales bacterium]|nr:hypothetical protein [Candidatus Acidoferrales bacterium]
MPNQRTYWAASECHTLDEACQNLKNREQAQKIDDIHWLTAKEQHTSADQGTAARIREWLQAKNFLGAAIWTGLRSNWTEKVGTPFTVEHAIAYLKKLEAERDKTKAAYDRAREYIRNAPSQIQTPLRRALQEKKGWEDAVLPPVLFE